MGKEQGSVWYVNCTLEILKTRVEKSKCLSLISNRLGEEIYN
jgi:hypothetical protein